MVDYVLNNRDMCIDGPYVYLARQLIVIMKVSKKFFIENKNAVTRNVGGE